MKGIPQVSWQLVWLSILLAPAFMLFAQWSRMLQKEYYHYLPALAIAFALLVHNRWDRQMRPPTTRLGISLFIVGVVVLLGTILVPMPWLGAVGWLIVVGAFLFSHTQANGASLGHLWPLTWLSITLPLSLDEQLIQLLQSRSSRMSSYLLDMIGVPHVLLGNVIELTSGRLFVEEACSGVQSVFTLLFVSTLLVVGLRRITMSLPLYWLAAIFWATLMNVMRILTIAYVRQVYQLDWATGWRHATLGYVTLGLAIVLLLSTDRLIRVLLFPTNSDGELVTNPLVRLWTRAVSLNEKPLRIKWQLGSQLNLAMCFCCVFVLGAQYRLLASNWGQLAIVAPNQTPLFSPPAVVQIDGFVLANHEHVEGSIDMPYGLDSDVYRGSVNGLPVVIAISQTYPNWHDLCVCYAGIGWQLNERKVETDSQTGSSIDLVESRWLSPSGSFGFLLFSGFSEKGAPVPAKKYALYDRMLDRLSANWNLQIDGTQRVAMVQIFCESAQPLDATTIAALQAVHIQSRQQFSKLLVKGL